MKRQLFKECLIRIVSVIVLVCSSLLCACDLSWIDDLLTPTHLYPDETRAGSVTCTALVDYWGEINTFEISADASIYYGAQSYKSLNFAGTDYWAGMTMDSALDGFYNDLLAQFEPIKKKYSLDDDQYVALITMYVQDIPYDDEADVTAKYPVVTAIDNLGDCDEKSMLLAGLLAHAGYDVALIDVPGHMMVGIRTDDVSAFIDGYAAIETTYRCWPISCTDEDPNTASLMSLANNGTKKYRSGVKTQEINNYLFELDDYWDDIESSVNHLYYDYMDIVDERDYCEDYLRELNKKYDAGEMSYAEYSPLWDEYYDKYVVLDRISVDLYNLYYDNFNTYDTWLDVYNTVSAYASLDLDRALKIIHQHPLDTSVYEED